MGKGCLNIPLICADAMLMLSDAELGRLTRAAVLYLSEDRELTLDGAERLVFATVKASIDRERAISEKRAEIGRKGGIKAKQNEANVSKAKQTQANVSKAKQNEAKNFGSSLSSSPPEPPITSILSPDCVSPKEKPPKGGKKKGPLVPPTLEQVRAYCLERRNGIDPAAFLAYYEANGWVQGRACKPIVDWQACIRTWEAKEPFAGQEEQRPAAPRYLGLEIVDGEEVAVFERPGG